jgi:hypothetical protein
MGHHLGSIPIPSFSPTRIYKVYQHKLIWYVTEVEKKWNAVVLRDRRPGQMQMKSMSLFAISFPPAMDRQSNSR